jgi:hypothetical protein
MKPTTFFLGLAATTSANIIFTHVPLNCNLTNPLMYHGCLLVKPAMKLESM